MTMPAIRFSDAMLSDLPTMTKFARKALAGESVAFEKVHFVEAIQKLGDRRYPASLSRQQRFTKAMDDPDGRELYQASKAVSGSETYPQDEEGGVQEDQHFVGPAYREMMVLARDLQLANPFLSEQQAFSRVYTSLKNKALRDKIIAEATAHARATTSKAAPPLAQQIGIESRGPAHDKLEKLTAELEAREPTLSHAQAFTKVFCDPANIALRDASKIEHMRAVG
jgi:hypothetical protein